MNTDLLRLASTHSLRGAIGADAEVSMMDRQTESRQTANRQTDRSRFENKSNMYGKLEQSKSIFNTTHTSST